MEKLPEKWYVKTNKEICDWYSNKLKVNKGYYTPENHTYLNSHDNRGVSIFDSKATTGSFSHTNWLGYTEISFDDFKRFVLKEEVQLIPGKYYYGQLSTGWIVFKPNEAELYNSGTHFHKVNFPKNVTKIEREATSDEIKWLEACISANKFILKEEVLKSYTPEYVECLRDNPGHFTNGKVYHHNINEDKEWGSLRVFSDDSGKSNGWNKDYFKPSTKEAYEAQNKPKFEIGKWYKRNDYTDTIGSTSNSDWLVYFKISEINPILCSSEVINAKGIYKKERVAYLGDNKREVLLSEIQQYLPEGHPDKQWIPKVGEWAVLEKNINHEGGIVGTIFKIGEIKRDKELWCTKETQVKSWLYYSKEACRKALPHEIPSQELSKEELLEEAKRRYPVGTKFKSAHQGDKYTRVKGEYWSDKEGSSINIVWNGEKYHGAGWLYKDGKWAEIVQEEKIHPLSPDGKYNEVREVKPGINQESFQVEVQAGKGIRQQIKDSPNIYSGNISKEDWEYIINTYGYTIGVDPYDKPKKSELIYFEDDDLLNTSVNKTTSIKKQLIQEEN